MLKTMRRQFSFFTSRSLLLLLVASVLSVAGCGVVAPQQQQTKRATPAPSPTAAPDTTNATRPAEGESINRATSEPYTGDLSIFENPERDEKLQVERVMDVLGIKQGASVADIGAGSGWFTVRAARRVGERGAVYAVEINRDYLKHIEERAAKERLTQIRTVLGKEDDPLLPEKSLDAVLMLKTYHEISQPVRLLTRLRQSMRPGARLGIIDRNGKGDDHGIERDIVVREAARAGFTLAEEHDFVKPDGMDYFLVFQLRR
jgi:predicted methyltransferase